MDIHTTKEKQKEEVKKRQKSNVRVDPCPSELIILWPTKVLGFLEQPLAHQSKEYIVKVDIKS